MRCKNRHFTLKKHNLLSFFLVVMKNKCNFGDAKPLITYKIWKI